MGFRKFDIYPRLFDEISPEILNTIIIVHIGFYSVCKIYSFFIEVENCLCILD